MPYRNLMAVYDGTPQADELLDMMCSIARPERAQFTILYVRLVPLAEPLPVYQAGVDPQMDAFVAQAEKLAEKRGVKAASAVRYGRTLGGAVLAEARVCGVDLLAMLAPDAEALQTQGGLGTDIENVLRKATCAVIICRPKE